MQKQVFDWSLALARVCDKVGFADFMIVNITPWRGKTYWNTWSDAVIEARYAPERSRFHTCRDIFIADSVAETNRRALANGLADAWCEYLIPIDKKFNLLQGIIDDSGTGIHPNDVDENFLAEHVWICGSPETAIAKLERMVEKGMIVVNSHDNNIIPEPRFELLLRFASEVAPKVQKSL